MANPKVEVDYKVLDALLQFKVPLYFVADYMGVSRDTIIRRLREDHDMTYAEYHDLRLQRTATKLQQKAIEMALAGNATMMIFKYPILRRFFSNPLKKGTAYNRVKKAKGVANKSVFMGSKKA